jgi:hypothetical protein
MIGLSAPAKADRRFRVEYRRADEVLVLARVTRVFPHHSTLQPYLTRLVWDGASGEVVLVDEATGADVARRRLAVPASI